jgi:hypothetical protein
MGGSKTTTDVRPSYPSLQPSPSTSQPAEGDAHVTPEAASRVGESKPRDSCRPRAMTQADQAAENAAKIQAAREAKQAAAAEFDARVQPSGTAKLEREKPNHAAAGVPDDVWRVLATHEVTGVEHWDHSGKWAIALGETIREHRLTAEHIRLMLDLWRAERDKIGDEYAAKSNAGEFPRLRELWFFKNRRWVSVAIKAVRSAVSPPSAKLDPFREQKRLAELRSAQREAELDRIAAGGDL